MHNGIKSIDRRILAKQEQQQRAIEDGHALPVVPALPVVAEAKAESETAECSYHISPQMLWVAKLRKRTLQKGALIFNQSAKEGLKYLQETKLLPTPASPADIASFLRFTPDLNKERIGEFLGKNTEETKKILTEYIHTFDFTNISVLTALRMFLDTFRLPGEAQQIDRIMESFATYAYEQTKDHDILINPDVTYCFCFSVIMLNTDLHNPNISLRPCEVRLTADEAGKPHAAEGLHQAEQVLRRHEQRPRAGRGLLGGGVQEYRQRADLHQQRRGRRGAR